MFAIHLQWLIFIFLLSLAGVGALAVTVDRRRFRDPLLVRSGAAPSQLVDLFEPAPFGLLLLDLRGRIVYANAYARHLLPTNQSQKLPPDDFWGPKLENDLSTARTQDGIQPLYRLLTLSSNRTVSWWICPLPRLNLLFLTDLSHQRRLQKASQTFLSTLSHELRTPLTAVLAHLDIVRKREVDEKTREESLAISHQEVERLGHLVQDMLQLSRLEMSEGLDKQPLDLVMIAETAMAEVIFVAEAKGIAVSLEATSPLPRVPGDADKLKQVFLNLLDNSIKYGRSGDQIQVSLQRESEGVRAVIQDTGPGIPPEHLPHVTERLYRASKDVEGSGLGLAIVAEILRLHDTQLEIDSPGENGETGVEVSFLLPCP